MRVEPVSCTASASGDAIMVIRDEVNSIIPLHNLPMICWELFMRADGTVLKEHLTPML